MRMYGVIAGAALVVLTLNGCLVSQSKYQGVMAESDAAKSELERVRTQKSALEQQVKSLKDTNGKLSADTEFMSAELQRIKDSREKERASGDTRIKELERKLKEVMASSRALKQEFDDVKKHNESLKTTIARYQKELKERERGVRDAAGADGSAAWCQRVLISAEAEGPGRQRAGE